MLLLLLLLLPLLLLALAALLLLGRRAAFWMGLDRQRCFGGHRSADLVRMHLAKKHAELGR